MSDGFEHAPNLTVAAFVDRDAYHVRLDERRLCRRRDAIVEFDTFAQRAQRAARRTAPDLREALLLDPEARMGQPVGELTVVREQEQPLRVLVEPSDGE